MGGPKAMAPAAPYYHQALSTAWLNAALSPPPLSYSFDNPHPTKEHHMSSFVSIKQALQIMLDIALPEKHAVELIGPPGCAKSEGTTIVLPRLITQLTGMPCVVITMECSGIEPSDGQGFAIPTKITHPDGSTEIVMTYARPDWWPTQGFAEGTFVILFLDEWGKTPPDVKKVFAPLILERRIGQRYLPENTFVVLASNRAKDKSGEYESPAHIINRRMELHISHDYEGWENWALNNNVHALTVAFAKRNMGIVFTEEVPAEPGPFCTPRSLVKMDQAMQRWTRRQLKLDDSAPLSHLVSDPIAQAASSGWVGPVVSAAYHAFIRVVDELPTLEEIVANPTKAKVPDHSRMDAVLVICNQLALTITEDTVDPYLKYMMRLPREMQAATVSRFYKRDPRTMNAVYASKHFVDWAHKHADVVSAALKGTQG